MQAMSCPAVWSLAARPSHRAAFHLAAERLSPVREIGKLERALFLLD
jgi:hypothetical protein